MFESPTGSRTSTASTSSLPGAGSAQGSSSSESGSDGLFTPFALTSGSAGVCRSGFGPELSFADLFVSGLFRGVCLRPCLSWEAGSSLGILTSMAACREKCVLWRLSEV